MASKNPRNAAEQHQRQDFPAARYVILASRLIPGLDGGFTIATLARARHMAQAGIEGGRGPVMLTVDPGSSEDHAQHRETFVARGAATSTEVFRNLFDDLRADPSWLYAAASEWHGATPDPEHTRTISDAAGAPIATIPIVLAEDWFLTHEPVIVHGDHGDRHYRGFRGLYQAWLNHVLDELSDRNHDVPVVVVCESRQIGLLLTDWSHPCARIVHPIHTSHLEAPYTADAPVNALWQRWFDQMPAFDAVLWPTEQQRHDVIARFGDLTHNAVVPSAAPIAVTTPAPWTNRAVVLTRLVTNKRLDHLVTAWREVVDAVPDAVLDIFGDGPLHSQLQEQIDSLGLASRVFLRGYTTYNPALFDGAAFTVQTSQFEGQGLAPLEAMSRGCPVLSYDVRYGPRDRSACGGEVLIPDGDTTALASHAIQLLQHPGMRDELSAGALCCARAHSTAATMRAMSAAVTAALSHPPRRTARA